MKAPRRHPTALRRLCQNVRLVVFDFDGVFTDNTVWVTEEGQEAVRCWRSDGLGLARLRKAGIAVRVLSTETNRVVSARCRKLRIPCTQGCSDKGQALTRLLRRQRLTADQVAYVGNDVNDLPCLTRVALPVVVRDAHPSILGVARYRTRAPGGQGAVREICDLLMELRSSENPAHV